MRTQAHAPIGMHVHTSRHTLTPCKHAHPHTQPLTVCPGPSLRTLTLAQGSHTRSHSRSLTHTLYRLGTDSWGGRGWEREGENPRLRRGRGVRGVRGRGK